MRNLASSVTPLTVAFFLLGCSSVDKSRLIDRAVPVVVTVNTDDTIVAGGLSSEVSRNFGRNILKQLTAGLEDRGIMFGSSNAPQSNVAVVKVDLIGLQGESVFDAGPFGASTKQDFKVSYMATLISPDGSRLFRIDGRESSEVFDELPGEVGRYVAKRVARHYQASE